MCKTNAKEDIGDVMFIIFMVNRLSAIEILDLADCISLCTVALWKGMNPALFLHVVLNS